MSHEDEGWDTLPQGDIRKSGKDTLLTTKPGKVLTEQELDTIQRALAEGCDVVVIDSLTALEEYRKKEVRA